MFPVGKGENAPTETGEDAAAIYAPEAERYQNASTE